MQSTRDASKLSLHNELRIRNREYFESQLAVHLMQHPEYFPSIHKISAAIRILLIKNSKAVIEAIEKNEKIIAELREPYFGSIFGRDQKVSAVEVFHLMVELLGQPKPDLRVIMQIHCIFIHRIYDNIEMNPDKAEYAKILFPDSLFNSRNRSREEVSHDIKTTSKLGITRHPYFSNKLGKSDKMHLRALDKFKPDYSVLFFQSANEECIPTVCGPSGHAGSLLLGAKLYGKLSQAELSEYALAAFAFLAAGGNHSYYEVYIVANRLGVAYDVKKYSASISENIKNSDTFKAFSDDYPQYLNEDESYRAFLK